MNSQEPFKISGIDFNKIVYPKIKASQNKKIILLKYNDNGKLKNFVIQTPTILNIRTPVKHNGYSEIELAMVGKEKVKVNKFINFLNSLEDKIKEHAQYNASSWFNLTDNDTVLSFQKVIRDSDEYPTGTVKMKIIKNNDFETQLQINNSKRIGIESIPEDSWCKMILECYAVWINANNDFGIFFRPILISFTPKEKQIYNYNFIEDSEENNDFDIPETESNNIFMNIDANVEELTKSLNDSTTQLEFNFQDQNQKEQVLDININDSFLSNSESDSEVSSEIDAETSDN